MGTLSVRIEVSNIMGGPSRQLEALVDTDITHSCMPEDVLRDLGVEPSREQRFRLADGRLVTYPVGEAMLRLQGKEWVVPVVFKPEGTMTVLGSTTLTIFGLGVDSQHKELVPIPLFLKTPIYRYNCAS
jgi:clan AA aspartic protease